MSAAEIAPGPDGTVAGGHGHQLRTGTDPAEAVALIEDLYNGRQLRIEADGAFHYRYRDVGDARVTLRTMTVGAFLSGILAPQRQYLLAWSVEGNVTIDPGTLHSVRLDPGVPIVFPTDRPFTIVAAPGTMHLVRFDATFLEAVAVAGTTAPPRPLELPQTVVRAGLEDLRAAVQQAAPALLDPTTTESERARLDVRLAEVLLQAFPPINPGVPKDGGVSTVERAKAFMHDHVDEQITAADVAVGAKCSVRTLQESFQRFDDDTPMAYLRRIRMEKARLALELADPSQVSVAELARACGLRHLGRFSGNYHDEFGEYPTQTLRRDPLAP